jgi:hypothetical protein
MDPFSLKASTFLPLLLLAIRLPSPLNLLFSWTLRGHLTELHRPISAAADIRFPFTRFDVFMGIRLRSAAALLFLPTIASVEDI